MLSKSVSKTSVRLTNVKTVVMLDAGDEKMSKVLLPNFPDELLVSQSEKGNADIRELGLN